MAVEIPEITDRNQDIALIAEVVHRIDHRTAQIEAELRGLLDAFARGGLRGFRAAAREAGNHD